MFKWLKKNKNIETDIENNEVLDELVEDQKLDDMNQAEDLNELNFLEGLTDSDMLNDIDAISDLGTLNDIDAISDLGTLNDIDAISDLGTLNDVDAISDLDTLNDVAASSDSVANSIADKSEIENVHVNKELDELYEVLEDESYELPVFIESEAVEVGDKQDNKSKNFFSKLVDGLSKTRANLIGGVEDVLKSFKSIDEEFYEELEEALIMADLGVNTTLKVIEDLRIKVKENKLTSSEEVRQLLKDELKSLMFVTEDAYDFVDKKTVLLIIGVNGVGKTTTIGKLSNQYKQAGKSVMLAAADTFRAAAIDQLKEWALRADVPLIAQGENADPSAVIYDAIQSAKAKKTDILICDTAGRLHNKKNLMDELNKIYRVIEREYSDAHKEVLLVLDSTTGQNAVQQAKVFQEAANITGVVLTKLDGTAKGGIAIAIQSELKLPVKYIGVGEGIDDMRPFDSNDFIDALFND